MTIMHPTTHNTCDVTSSSLRRASNRNRNTVLASALALLSGIAPATAQSWTATPAGPHQPISPQLLNVTMNGMNAFSSFGQAVGRLGDLTGDNLAEVLIGAPDEVGLFTNQFAGQAHVRGARNGAEVLAAVPLQHDRQCQW